MLALMLAEGFVAFVTVDQEIEFLQNLQNTGIGIVVVQVRKNRLTELRPLAPKILEALTRISSGRVIRVGS